MGELAEDGAWFVELFAVVESVEDIAESVECFAELDAGPWEHGGGSTFEFDAHGQRLAADDLGLDKELCAESEDGVDLEREAVERELFDDREMIEDLGGCPVARVPECPGVVRGLDAVQLRAKVIERPELQLATRGGFGIHGTRC